PPGPAGSPARPAALRAQSGQCGSRGTPRPAQHSPAPSAAPPSAPPRAHSRRAPAPAALPHPATPPERPALWLGSPSPARRPPAHGTAPGRSPPPAPPRRRTRAEPPQSLGGRGSHGPVRRGPSRTRRTPLLLSWRLLSRPGTPAAARPPPSTSAIGIQGRKGSPARAPEVRGYAPVRGRCASRPWLQHDPGRGAGPTSAVGAPFFPLFLSPP